MEHKMETTIMGYRGGCQNFGPFLGPKIIIGTPKGTTILTTTHRETTMRIHSFIPR